MEVPVAVIRAVQDRNSRDLIAVMDQLAEGMVLKGFQDDIYDILLAAASNVMGQLNAGSRVDDDIGVTFGSFSLNVAVCNDVTITGATGIFVKLTANGVSSLWTLVPDAPKGMSGKLVAASQQMLKRMQEILRWQP